MQAIFHKANEVLNEINQAQPKGADEIEQFRIKYLGSKNVLKDLFGSMGQVTPERKKEYGQLSESAQTNSRSEV